MVSLTPITPDDFTLVSGWLSDETINRWLTSEWRGRHVTPTVIAMVIRNPRNRLFVVQSDGVACGLVGLADIDEIDRTAMVWYLLGRQAHGGRGVTSHAVGEVVKWAFTELGLASVYAWIMADNERSRRVLEKSGFRQAGTLRRATRSADRQVDRIYFDIVSADTATVD